MKLYTYTKFISLVGMGALASCAPQPETYRVPVSGSLHPDSSLSEQVSQEVNTYRRNRGANMLQRHAGLDRLAQEHSEYLRKNRGSFTLNGKNVSHIGFDGRVLVARERYRMANLSENVAAAPNVGKSPGPTLVRMWADSKGHEYNMRASWTHTGIGVVVDDDGMVFCTQLFATANTSQLTNHQRFGGF